MATRRNPLLTVLVVFTACFAQPQTTKAQSVANGGFESPDVATFVRVAAGATTISPWVVGLDSVDLADVNNGFVVGPAFEGSQYLDLDGSAPGRITQPLSTVPGQPYLLTFAYANNYLNQLSASATVRLFDSLGDRSNVIITHGTSQAGNLNWTPFSIEFVALQNLTSLEFTSLSPAGRAGGILLDAIAIQAIPEPHTGMLFMVAAASVLRLRKARMS